MYRSAWQGMEKFELVSTYRPTGDQPQAIEKLTEGVLDGIRTQVLVGVTGSGKTFTMANVIQNINRPTLVIAHNKTLAAQLCNEFREFFPHNRVEYFVSYYDYYQPESYIPSTDTYIEKDMSVNDEIDKLRNSATASLGRAQRRARRGVRLLHLRPGRAGRVLRPGDLPAARRRDGARRTAPPPDRIAIRAQGHRLYALVLPRARGHRRDLPRGQFGDRHPRRIFRRRDRPAVRGRGRSRAR